MSYVALYRKWRPTTFDDVKGQDAIVTTLKNQVKSGRVGHAYLFCGTRGTGKTSVAKILARAVNCKNGVDGSPCNECDVCKSILNDTSMNVIEIDAASNNGVDNIRDIREQVQYPPTEGKYKVFIIDEVHMLSIGAFNALLKTLEEPPEYVIFILATTEVHKIPVTILSRCQRYDFKRIPVATICERLRELTTAENIDIEDKAINYIAKNADGAMRDAISLLDECVAFHPNKTITYESALDVLGGADVETYAKLFEAISQARTVDALRIVEEAVTAGKELGTFTSDFLWYLRNLLVLMSTDDVGDIIDASKENLEVMKESASNISLDALARYIRIFAELSNSMKFSNQKRVLLELAIVKLVTPQMQEDMSSVLERLARLENGSPRAMNSSNATQNRTIQRSFETDDSKLAKVDNSEKDVVHITTKSTSSTTSGAAPATSGGKTFLTHDWSSLIRSVGGAGTSVLKDTTVEKETDDTFNIVFHNSGCFNLGFRDSIVEKLAKEVENRYGRKIRFVCKLASGISSDTDTFVSKEELSKVISMPIEVED